jgi:predicted  nucleic acid-binding Zn-ribbon protein
MSLENLNLLWEYQNADFELMKFEASVKNTPTRKQLVKLQRFLRASQEKIGEFENLARVKHNEISELESQYKALLADMKDIHEDIGYYSECADEELDEASIVAMGQNAEKTHGAVAGVRKNLRALKDEIDSISKNAVEVISKMKTAKAGYDLLKVKHDEEISNSDSEMKKYKKRLSDIEKQLPEKFISEYRRIKGFRQNPVAKFESSRCSGCNMQLPSNVAGLIQSSQDPFECENCGRILILP